MTSSSDKTAVWLHL